MAGGLFALLDDIAALAKLAAASIDDVGAAASKATAKAAGVVVDDTAVTPQYLAGSAAAREVPIVKKIAIGSLRNKLLFILPAAMILSEFLPKALPVLLILGGSYLAYEGAEKVWERISGNHEEVVAEAEDEIVETGGFTPEHEARTIASAIRTDFILSAEIMVIALKEVVSADPPPGFVERALILVAVALLITALVYGVVALIVKMDDAGVHLSQKPSKLAQRVGGVLVEAMPSLLAALSIIGTAAMLWVGGHILLTSLDELGVHGPYSVVHHLEEWAHDLVPAIGTALAWIANTLASALVGLVIGAILVVVMHLVPRRSAAHH